MTKMKAGWKKILFLGGFLLTIVLASGCYWRYQSLPAQMARLETAVNKHQWTVVEKMIPRFANGRKISKESYQLFEVQLTTKKAKQVFMQQLTKPTAYQIENKTSWFKPKKFLPQARYLSWSASDVPSKTTIYISGQNQLWQLSNQSHQTQQAYFPGQYQLDLTINNQCYGKVTQHRQVNLNQHNYQLKLTPDYFINQPDFQNHRLADVLTYYQSLNQSINQQLDFSHLEGVTAKDRAEVARVFAMLKPNLKAYQQQFQELAMNVDSLKIDGGQEPQVTFDLYIDLKQAVQVIAKTDKTTFELTNDDRQNATVTMQYSTDEKQWLIQTLDFETYEQAPSEWMHKRQVRLKQPNQANWQANQQQET